jgi:SAM-dependent methyltransferase
MFTSYKDIFNQRSNLYHQAMVTYPLARKEEFKQILQLADLEDGHVICDIPSGGCYISDFIDQRVKIISIETSAEFIRCSQSQAQENNAVIVCDSFAELPLISESVDRAISLAGLHHQDRKSDFYQESYRLLKKGGILGIADVRKGSGVDGFLNVFVDRYNSMGHKGKFLDEQTKNELEAVGFKVAYHSPISFYWKFDSLQNMIEYCRLLFGIDKANDPQILEGIKQFLGYQILANQYCLNWELYFFKAIK